MENRSGTFCWLQLSDIHQGMEGHEDAQISAYKECIDHIRERIRQNIVPHCIFVTGDVAQGGKQQQYREVQKHLFSPLQKCLGDHWSGKIVTVPGNHDLDRELIDWQATVRQSYVDALVPRYNKNKNIGRRKKMNGTFGAYVEWDKVLSGFDGNHWIDHENGAKAHRPFPQDFPWLWIVQLNTSWVAWGDDGNKEGDESGLSCGRFMLTKTLEEVPENAFCIVLGHHPLGWLETECRDDAEAFLGKRNAIYLHGHLHKPEATRGAQFQDYIAIQGGATYQAYNNEIEPNSVLWGQIDISKRILGLYPAVRRRRVWKRGETMTGFQSGDDGWDTREILYHGGAPLDAKSQDNASRLSCAVDGSTASPQISIDKVSVSKHEIIFLSDARAQDAKRFGQKSARLAFLVSKGFPVPSGFCLDTDLISALDVEKDGPNEALDSINDAFNKLIKDSKSGFVIVRSSSTVEDDPQHLFPGLFPSISRVRNIGALMDAIRVCKDSIGSQKVLEYAQARKVDASKITMAVLIQQQLESTYSGVAFTKAPVREYAGRDGVYVEFITGGNLSQSDQEHPLFAYFLFRGDNSKNTVSLEPVSTTTLHRPEENKALKSFQKLYDLAERVKNEFDGDQDIEWVILRNGNPQLVQTRPLVTKSPHSAATGHKIEKLAKYNRVGSGRQSLFENEHSIGLKGAAMSFFVAEGLFGLPTVIVSPGESTTNIDNAILTTNFGEKGITIRFSFENEIGLPRHFVKTNSEALTWFYDNWDSRWLGIIYGYMNVTHSFELYLDKDMYVLEHVPGVWESDNIIEPDVIIDTVQQETLLRSTKPSLGYFIDPDGVSHKEVHPVGFSDMFHWREKLAPTLAKLRARFGKALPINVHFVADDTGEWHFLNIRIVGTLKTGFQRRGRYHVVRSVDDIATWDRRKPILLQMTAARGTERDLIKILDYLPKNTNQIYISFGLLSHPAIVLREYGLYPIPLYSSHEVLRKKKGGRNV